jgi:hypothetical protein
VSLSLCLQEVPWSFVSVLLQQIWLRDGVMVSNATGTTAVPNGVIAAHVVRDACFALHVMPSNMGIPAANRNPLDTLISS